MKKLTNVNLIIILSILPIIFLLLPLEFSSILKSTTSQVICFAILGLGINYSITHVGILNLGGGGFMAIGAYVCSILVTNIYPFQFNYLTVYLISIFIGALFGLLLSILSLRLKGDYLAIITLAFSEVIQDLLKNLDVITKGTKSINPLPNFSIFGFEFPNNSWQYFYLFLIIFIGINFLINKLSKSKLGLRILAVKDDETAASTLGLNPIKYRTIGLIISSGLCALAGSLFVTTIGTSGEPGNYDFSISVLALAIVILSNNKSNLILISAIGIIVFTNLILPGFSELLIKTGLTNTDSLIMNSNNWKYAIFGLILIITMHWRSNVKSK